MSATPTSERPRPATPIAWAVTLLVSLLPDILFVEISGDRPEWLFWAKVGLAGALLALSLVWKELRGLRLFFGVLLVLYLIEWGVSRMYERVAYAAWLAKAAPFVQEVGAVQIVRSTSAVLMVLAMLVLVRRFDRFFLVKGRLDAPAKPIPVVLTRPPTWRVLGPAISGAMCLGLVAFALAAGRPPTGQALRGVLPLLPFVVLFAASNAFGEEMLYRAPWLAALEGPAGPAQALLMTAAYFGLAHFYGVPYGVPGVLMAFIPGWLMGKAMLETRGFLWAWLIHFSMDLAIFFFMALGAVAPGG